MISQSCVTLISLFSLFTAKFKLNQKLSYVVNVILTLSWYLYQLEWFLIIFIFTLANGLKGVKSWLLNWTSLCTTIEVLL